MIIDLAQNTDIWLSYRRSRVGASDVPIIMGESPYKTPIRLWREKLGLEVPFVNDKMREGSRLEPIARECFNRANDFACKPVTMVSDDNPWLMASLDGYDPFYGILLEIKCANDLDHALARDGKVPLKYFGQCQAQMYVSGLPVCYYFSYQNDSQYTVLVNRDDIYIEQMLIECKKFYDKLMDFEEPELTDKDYKDMSQNDLWREYEDRYSTLNQLMDFYKEEMDTIKVALIEMAENQNCQSNTLKLYKSIRKGSIDYKQIPELKSLDLEKYRKPNSEVWTLRCQ